MAERGGKRKGAGRKPGSLNKKTAEQVKAVEESGITPLEYILSVMREPIPEDTDPLAVAQMKSNRLDAAKAAAPYVHPRLSSVVMDTKIALSHEDALDALEYGNNAS